ncbi:MAG TPA: hypothetical protein VN857_16255 [Chthoniobacterales bacterium]|nr:hypothetical protein [Chthoniobacterales bacterium]
MRTAFAFRATARPHFIGRARLYRHENIKQKSRLALCLGLSFFAIQLLQAMNLAKKVALVTDASKGYRSFDRIDLLFGPWLFTKITTLNNCIISCYTIVRFSNKANCTV